MNCAKKYLCQIRSLNSGKEKLAGYLSVSSRVYFFSSVVGQQETAMGHRENDTTWGWA